MANNDAEKSKAEGSDLAATVEKMKNQFATIGAQEEEIGKIIRAGAKQKDDLRKLLKKT